MLAHLFLGGQSYCKLHVQQPTLIYHEMPQLSSISGWTLRCSTQHVLTNCSIVNKVHQKATTTNAETRNLALRNSHFLLIHPDFPFGLSFPFPLNNIRPKMET